MTPTAYIPVPIGQNPEKDGWYMVNFKDSPLFENREFKDGEWKTRWKDELLTFLKPVDLSRMLEDCWKAAVDSVKDATGMREKYDDTWIEHDDKAIESDKAEYFNSVLNPPKMTEEQLTKDWQEYSGYYCKAMQDIKLKNGDEIMMCWPNAGVWNVCSDGPYKNQEIKNSDVTHVRKTHDKNW